MTLARDLLECGMWRWLEKRLGWMAIPQITIHLVIIHALFFVFALFFEGWAIFAEMILIPARILEGEFWRAISWVFIPPYPFPRPFSILFNFFALYLFWIYGNALEEQWGSFKYNAYLWLGVLFSFLAAWLDPWGAGTNALWMLSVLFAFAVYFPDFEIRLFLILPVKIKWIALLSVGLLLFGILQDPWPRAGVVVVSLGHFFIFFWEPLRQNLQWKIRRRQYESQQMDLESLVRYECQVCGKTDRDYPELDFRFCSRCEGALAYCEEHLREHTHVKADLPQSS